MKDRTKDEGITKPIIPLILGYIVSCKFFDQLAIKEIKDMGDSIIR